MIKEMEIMKLFLNVGKESSFFFFLGGPDKMKLNACSYVFTITEGRKREDREQSDTFRDQL